MTGRRGLGMLMMVAVLTATGLWSCGGSDGDRDNKTCQRCDERVNPGCFDECRDFCVPDDPNCDTRCAAQCDVCRRDLVCSECLDGCTGAPLRCAPQNEVVQCEDGAFGGNGPP